MKSIQYIFENRLNESSDLQTSLQKYVKKLAKDCEKVINNDKIDLTPLEKAIKGGESKLDPDLIRIAKIMSV